MKKILLFLSFIFLILVLPVQASEIEKIDVSVDVPLSVESDCIDNTNIQGVSVLNKVVISSEQLTGFNILIAERNLYCTTLSSQEVDFVDTGYLVQYSTNSKETISEIPDVSNVNVHFGSINFLDTCFMSAHNYKRTS